MTLLLYDDLCLKHIADVPHVESAERLRVIVERLRNDSLWDRCAHPSARDATPDDLALIHTPAHINNVRRIAEDGGGALDLDTPLSADSYAAAIRAVGLVMEGAEQIAGGRADNGFALVRPPGHHATSDRGTGFCLFNNVAIAARHLQRRKRLEKILIADWDIHHGNGTQAAFYDDDAVMYISAHAWPFYPGTGDADERGAGAGEGYTVNLPMPLGTAAGQYVEAMREALLGRGKEFDPDFVLVSAGFDAATGDPIGVFDLEAEHFESLTRAALELAAECCDGRLLSVLEGGYNLERLAECAAAHVRALTDAGGEATE